MVPLGYTLLELSEEIEFKLKICIILSSSLNGFYNKFQHQLLLNPRKLLPTIYTPSSMRVFKYWITTLTMRFISFCMESSNAYWRCSRVRGWGTKILRSLRCKFRQNLMSAYCRSGFPLRFKRPTNAGVTTVLYSHWSNPQHWATLIFTSLLIVQNSII